MVSEKECVPRSPLGEVGQMYYVYILQLIDDSLYIGFTTDLKKRIKNHNQGTVLST